MLLYELVNNGADVHYALIVETLCRKMRVDYEINQSSFGFDIVFKTTDRTITIPCSKSTCLHDFSTFLQGYMFAMDNARDGIVFTVDETGREEC